jgi:hypothetical protein
MHGSRSKISSKKSRVYIYIYDVKFLALLGAPYIYISRLRVKCELQQEMPKWALLKGSIELSPYSPFYFD